MRVWRQARIRRTRGVTTGSKDRLRADRINEAALSFVRENKDRPFLLPNRDSIRRFARSMRTRPYTDLAEWSAFVRGRGYGYTPHFTPRAAYAAMIIAWTDMLVVC